MSVKTVITFHWKVLLLCCHYSRICKHISHTWHNASVYRDNAFTWNWSTWYKYKCSPLHGVFVEANLSSIIPIHVLFLCLPFLLGIQQLRSRNIYILFGGGGRLVDSLTSIPQFKIQFLHNKIFLTIHMSFLSTFGKMRLVSTGNKPVTACFPCLFSHSCIPLHLYWIISNKHYWKDHSSFSPNLYSMCRCVTGNLFSMSVFTQLYSFASVLNYFQ
jgi:hypothetical protein